ncbi:hypothetical protein E4U52_008359 [Claviceps spartinae]|nr:hypothetical protein E4U52_008359 [Claviceps spartinae]
MSMLHLGNDVEEFLKDVSKTYPNLLASFLNPPWKRSCSSTATAMKTIECIRIRTTSYDRIHHGELLALIIPRQEIESATGNTSCKHSRAKHFECFECAIPEGASGEFEIKESSDALVRRMLDYIYTGKYDDLPSNHPTATQDGKRSSTKVAKLGPALQVLLHAKMMELGDMYLVDGLSLFANERFGVFLKSETTRNILVDIVPEVYAMEFKSCRFIRKILIDLMRRRLARGPLSAEVEGSLEDATKDVPEFTRDLFKSFKDMSHAGARPLQVLWWRYQDGPGRATATTDQMSRYVIGGGAWSLLD